MEGYFNVDLCLLEGVDVVADLHKIPWPFRDDQFEIILCNHYIEHAKDIVQTMEEINRIGKNGCQVVIRTPYFANYESFRDPTHRWHLTWESLDYFTTNSPRSSYFAKCKFRMVKKKLTFAHPWRHPGYYLFRLNVRTYEKYFSHLFPGTWLIVQMEVSKELKD